MTQITHDVSLPVGIIITTGKKTKTIKKIEMRSISMAESYAKMIEADDETALTGLLDLAAMSFAPELGRSLSYDEVANASRQDGLALEMGRVVVEKKERGELTIAD